MLRTIKLTEKWGDRRKGSKVQVDAVRAAQMVAAGTAEDVTGDGNEIVPEVTVETETESAAAVTLEAATPADGADQPAAEPVTVDAPAEAVTTDAAPAAVEQSDSEVQ
jgi:hypothetical protein